MLLKGDLNDNILMGFEMNFTDKGKNILKYSCSSLICPSQNANKE